MINVNSQPFAIAEFNDTPQPPVPMSDCVKFCITPDAADVVATAGAKATVVFVVPLSCTVPSNGTPFKIWGHAFTIDSATDFSSSSVKVVTSGITTAINLGNMIQANVFFSRATTVSAAVVSGTIHVTVTWNDCREQSSFSGANMNLTVFSTIGGSATATNGISPEYVDSYRIITRAVRWTDATSVTVPLSPFSGVDVEKLCDEAGETCINIGSDVSKDLYTMLPALSTSSVITSIENGRSLMRYYSLEYGWTYRENCVSKSGTIKKSDKVLCINAAFDINDAYQMRRHWPGHPDGLPPGQSVVNFLTTAPKEQVLCWDSFKWLWLLNNYKEDYPNYALVARWVLYDQEGALISIHNDVVMNPGTMGSSPYQAVCLNVSPKRIIDVLGITTTVAATIGSYDIQVVGTSTGDYDDVLFNASEYLKFIPKNICCDFTDLYFLSPCGGIDTIPVRIDAIDIQQDTGSEIIIEIDCGASRIDRAANGGRSFTQLRAYTKMSFSIQIMPGKEWAKWAKALRASPQRWIKQLDDDGVPFAKKLLIEAGSFRTNETGTAGPVIEFTGYLQDIPVQSGTEKFIL